jgi:hypothetical protein
VQFESFYCHFKLQQSRLLKMKGTSGGSNLGPANSGAAREVGEVEVAADEAHIDESTPNQANST